MRWRVAAGFKGSRESRKTRMKLSSAGLLGTSVGLRLLQSDISFYIFAIFKNTILEKRFSNNI